METLIEGYRRFRAEVWPSERRRFEALADGQQPETMVIACSDSRVDPSMVFGAAPGELFVVRNVAALVPPYTPDGGRHGVSAALEFAVRVLGVKRIVVLGHAQCGGVQALIQGVPEDTPDFVGPWMSIAEPVREQAHCRGAHPDSLAACEEEVVKLSVNNLRTFPWIAKKVDAGELQLEGARFGIASGVLSRLGPDGRFAAVEAD